MKTKILLSLCVILLSLALAACSHPPPLPEPPPTPIPTLIPATEPPPGAQNTPQPGVTLPTAPPDATAGLAVYQEQCAGCHGADGKGKVEGSRDFTDVDYMRGAAPVDFFAAVTNGKGDMPAFKDKLTDEQRWNATWALWSFAVPAAEIAQGKTVYRVGRLRELPRRERPGRDPAGAQVHARLYPAASRRSSTTSRSARARASCRRTRTG